ncbi:MAG: hypothetical protein JWP10_1525 [Nocardioidaceae bacterium]|nr:hypothetical protein [Nocardioidaceae bacterium]
MDDSRVFRSKATRRRMSWALFCGASVLALGFCVLLASAAGGRSSVGVVLLGGLIVVGIGAALLDSFISPLPKHELTLSGRYGAGGGGFAGATGAGGSGGGGGGDCGGAGGSCN